MIVNKTEARADGLKRYFTGKACSNGHIAERRVDNGQCVECIRNKDKKRSAYFAKWRKSNKEKCVLYTATYRERNPGVGAEYMARMRELNGDALRAAARRQYANNRDKFAVKGRTYRKAKPELYAEHARNRRAKEAKAEGSHTYEQIQSLMVKQRYKCANCRKSIKNSYHADHVIALSRGGSNYITNIQLLCPSCNSRKRDRDPIEFAQSQGKLL
jgi:5-methylcytosine-specific restriction endonuclease McrA